MYFFSIGAQGHCEPSDSPSASGSDDFQQIDKDRWSEMLENLDPEDFKFKV